MNYLTNYYKNLCEQLQERINILQERINTPQEIRQIGKNKMANAIREIEKSGYYVSPEQISRSADEHYMPYANRAYRREQMVNRAAAELGSMAQFGDTKEAQRIGDVLAHMLKPGSFDPATLTSTKIAGGANLSPEQAARENELAQVEFENQKGLRDLGIVTNVPPDIQAMRSFIRAGRGQYQPPRPRPEGPVRGMHVNPTQY